MTGTHLSCRSSLVPFVFHPQLTPDSLERCVSEEVRHEHER